MLIGLVDYLARGDRAEVVPHLDGSVIPEGDYLQAGQIALFDGKRLTKPTRIFVVGFG
jgi:hypothetical protein